MADLIAWCDRELEHERGLRRELAKMRKERDEALARLSGYEMVLEGDDEIGDWARRRIAGEDSGNTKTTQINDKLNA